MKKDKATSMKGVEYVEVDYNNIEETFGKALEGIDKLFLDTFPSPKMLDYGKKIIDEASKIGISPSLIKDNLEKLRMVRDGHVELLTGDGEKFLGRQPSSFKTFAIEFAHSFK